MQTVWSLAVAVLLAVSLAAQPQAEKAPPRERAFGVLERLLVSTERVQDPGLRARLQAQIADALWDRDPGRARDLFKEAFNSSAAIVNPETRAEREGEILVLMSLRDATVAEALPDQRQGAEPYLRAATILAEDDAENAVQIAKRHLQGAIENPLLLDLLLAIRLQEPALSDALFRAALAEARRHTPKIRVTVGLFAQYVFQEYTTLNPILAREFLNFVYDLVAGTAGSPGFGVPIEGGGSSRKTSFQAMAEHLAVQPLLGYFDQYMPEKAASLRTRLDQKLDMLPTAREREFVRNLRIRSLAPPVEELLERAERAEEVTEKDRLFLQAALQASRDGRADRALSIAAKAGSNRLGGFDVVSQIHYDAARAALEERDAETAYRHSQQLSDVRRHTQVVRQVARMLREKGETRRALEMLAQTARFVASAARALDKPGALLSLAALAARLDSNRGFDMAEAAVRALNDFAPDAAMPSVETAFRALARVDFDRALQIAQTIGRRDLSALAQLAVCRGALATRRTPAMRPTHWN